MVARKNSVHLRWNAVGLALLFAFAPLSSAFGGSTPSDPETLRQQAVSHYIDGATLELEAYRREIDAASRPDNAQQVSEATAKLAECARILDDLKTADEAHFDVIKEGYERARAELIQALKAAERKPG